MTPEKPSVLRRSYQRASFKARGIFELSILAVVLHIVAIVYYRYLSETAPYYNLITNVGLLLAPTWFLTSSYWLLAQTRKVYQPSNCRRRFHSRDTGCDCGADTYKRRESYVGEFETTYLSYYARRICLTGYCITFYLVLVEFGAMAGFPHYWSLKFTAACRPWSQHPLRYSTSTLHLCVQRKLVQDWSGLDILAAGVRLGCYGRYTRGFAWWCSLEDGTRRNATGTKRLM